MNRRYSPATWQHWSWYIRSVSTKHEGAMRAHPDSWKMKVKIFFRASRGLITTTRLYATPFCSLLPLLLTSSAASASHVFWNFYLHMSAITVIVCWFMTHAMPTFNKLSIVTVGQWSPIHMLHCQKWKPYMARMLFSKPICAKEEKLPTKGLYSYT